VGAFLPVYRFHALDEQYILSDVLIWRPGFGEITAAYVIGLLTDLPPRWLIDVHSGRRGSKEESKKCNWAKLIEWLEDIADDEPVDPAEQTDRAYWERKSDPTSLAIMDKLFPC
jgi:hypothetical protein